MFLFLLPIFYPAVHFKINNPDIDFLLTGSNGFNLSDQYWIKEEKSEIQKKNKALENQLLEEENMNIVKMVKTVNLDNKKLTAFLKAYAKGDITIPEEYLKEIEKMEDKKNAK